MWDWTATSLFNFSFSFRFSFFSWSLFFFLLNQLGDICMEGSDKNYRTPSSDGYQNGSFGQLRPELSKHV